MEELQEILESIKDTLILPEEYTKEEIIKYISYDIKKLEELLTELK